MNINIRSIILIVVALLIAGGAAMMARSLLNKPQKQVAGEDRVVVKIEESKMKILVAGTDMPTGHFVKAEDMVWQSWPDETVHENYIQQDAEITPDSLVGAVASSSLSAGEPILAGQLIKPGNRGFMSAVLPEGKRAISIRITATSGNAGFIFPGDHVDIMLTHEVNIKSNDREKARVSETILKNLRVLAINQSTDNPTHTPSIGNTATLEVTPKQAEKIALMKTMGGLTLTLRSLGNENNKNQLAKNNEQTITWDSDVSQPISTGSNGGSNGHNFSVEVFRGGAKKKEQTFDFNKMLNLTLSPSQGNKNDEETN